MATDKAADRHRRIAHLAKFVRRLRPGVVRDRLSFAILKERYWAEEVQISFSRKAAARWWNTVHRKDAPITSRFDVRLPQACAEYCVDSLYDFKTFDLRYNARLIVLYDKISDHVRCYPIPWQILFDVHGGDPN